MNILWKQIRDLFSPLWKYRKITIFVLILFTLEFYPIHKLNEPYINHLQLADKALCVIFLHVVISLLTCTTAALIYLSFKTLLVIQGIHKRWKVKKLRIEVPLPLVNFKTLLLTIFVHLFFLKVFFLLIKEGNVLIPEPPNSATSAIFFLTSLITVLTTALAICVLLATYIVNLHFLKKRGDFSWDSLKFPSTLFQTFIQSIKEGIPTKLPSRNFLKYTFIASILAQATVNFFLSTDSSNIENSWNPKPQVYFSSPPDSEKDITSYLLEIKHEFGISEESQEKALNNFRERVFNSNKFKIYIIDDFQGKIPTVAFFYGVPVVATFNHGTVVRKVLESTIKNARKEVQIIQKHYESLNENRKNKPAFPYIFKSEFFELLNQIEQEKGAIIINMSFGSETKNTDNFIKNLLYIRRLIELNNEGIVIFSSAGNRHTSSLLELNLDKAIAFLLSNYYVAGDPQGLQYGEINVSGTALIKYRNGALAKVRGTSFSSPTALGLFIQELNKELKHHKKGEKN